MTGTGGPTVSLEVTGAIATLRWSNPARRNAIGRPACEDLAARLEELARQPEVSVIHLDSADGPFCSGFDLTEFAGLDLTDPAQASRFFAPGRRLLAALREAPQAVLCAPRQYALGFGLSLLACSDYAVAPADAQFGLPEITAGVVPSTAVADLLAVMPARTVLRWALDGRRRSAAEAQAAQLVTDVVAPAELAGHTAALLADLAAAGELLAATKKTWRHLCAAAPADRTRVAVELATRNPLRVGRNGRAR